LSIGAPESSLFGLPRTCVVPVLIDATWPQIARLNLLDLVPALEMLVFFRLGRNDHGAAPWEHGPFSWRRYSTVIASAAPSATLR
jgi:hypothetical protein